MANLWVILALLASVISCSMANDSPGMKIGVTQAAMNYAADIAIDILSAELSGRSFPDMSGSTRVAVGKVDWRVSQLRLNRFNRPGSQVILSSALSWQLSGASAEASGQIHYEYKVGVFGIKIRDTVSFSMSANGVGVSIMVTLGRDGSGGPTIALTSCSSHVGGVNVHFNGGMGWLYNIFSSAVEGPVRNALNGMICNALSTTVQASAQQELAKLQLKFTLEKVMEFDCTLTQAPFFTNGYFESYHKGEMSWIGNKTEVPFQPSPMPASPALQMVNFWISDYVMNSLGYVTHNHGLLKYQLRRSDLPPNDSSVLNTSCTFSRRNGFCIGLLIPNLRKSFPNSYVALRLQTTAPPKLFILPGNLTGVFEGGIVFDVILPNGTEVYAFATHAKIQLSLSVKLEGPTAKLHIETLESQIVLTDSVIGPIKPKILDLMMAVATKAVIIPKLNELGEKGLNLPHINNVAYVNPTLSLLQGAVFFSADAKYTP